MSSQGQSTNTEAKQQPGSPSSGVFADRVAQSQRTSDEPIGLFRKRYRDLGPLELTLHDAIKEKADELASLIGILSPDVGKRMGIKPIAGAQLPKLYDAAGVTLAVRHLEDCVYRAIKALTG